MVKPLKNLDFFEAKHYYLMKSKLYAVFCAVFIFTICQAVYAQEDKGVTASGKEVDCSTIDPLVDKTVSEHGKVVLSPRVTRNGKLITAECAPIIPVIDICEDNFYGEITLTEVTDVVRVEILSSNNEIVATDDSPAVGNVFLGLPSGTYTVRAFSSTGHSSTQTANLVKNYTHCDVTHLNTNEMGTNYTQLDSVRDHQGNWYEVVEIGGKCWLRENMRCTTSPNGYLYYDTTHFSEYDPYYYLPGTAAVYKYGYLYNWAGAMDIANGRDGITDPDNHRGICPEGWHIPSSSEWVALRTSLVGNSTSHHNPDGYDYYADDTPIATLLAAGCEWLVDSNDANNKPGDYGNSLRDNSNFNLRPSPNYHGAATFNAVGRSTYFWTTNATLDAADIVAVHYTQTGMAINPYTKSGGRNIRCIRNEVVVPLVSVCENPFLGEIKLTEVEGVARVEVLNSNSEVVAFADNPAPFKTFSYIPSGIYTVRSISTSNDTAYQSVNLIKEFTHCTIETLRANESGFATQLDSVRDHEDNWYEVVQIGSQCWLKENMRCTTPPTGSQATSFTNGGYVDIDYTTPRYYKLQDQTIRGKNYTAEDLFFTYGILYNFSAAMAIDDWESSSFDANHRGICPEGWHIPTDAEWGMLEKTVLGATDDDIDRFFEYLGSSAGKLCESCDWCESTNTADPGSYGYIDRNTSGFNAFPAGIFDGGYHWAGESATFWTATPSPIRYREDYYDYDQGQYCWLRGLDCDASGMMRTDNTRATGCSVRCVRDN